FMNLLEKRKQNADLVLKKRFIRTVLDEQGKAIQEAQTKVMRTNAFSEHKFYSGRRMDLKQESVSLGFLKLHRFVDMKTRKSKDGIIKKKAHPIYNRIIFGHIPNIVRTLSFGYSDAVIEEMKKLEDL